MERSDPLFSDPEVLGLGVIQTSYHDELRIGRPDLGNIQKCQVDVSGDQLINPSDVPFPPEEVSGNHLSLRKGIYVKECLPTDNLFLPNPSKRYQKSASGKKRICFSKKELQDSAVSLQFALVGKFSFGYPTMQKIIFDLRRMKFKGSFYIGVINSKHILIRFEVEEDYLRLWQKCMMGVDRFPMRLLKWSLDFDPSVESPFAPVWIRLPGFPLALFSKQAIADVVGLIGSPIRVDEFTKDITRPFFARACVEINLLETQLEEIELELDGKIFTQRVIYENYPKYCSHCNHTGHTKVECFWLKPKEEREDLFRKRREEIRLKVGDNLKYGTGNRNEQVDPPGNSVEQIIIPGQTSNVNNRKDNGEIASFNCSPKEGIQIHQDVPVPVSGQQSVNSTFDVLRKADYYRTNSVVVNTNKKVDNTRLKRKGDDKKDQNLSRTQMDVEPKLQHNIVIQRQAEDVEQNLASDSTQPGSSLASDDVLNINKIPSPISRVSDDVKQESGYGGVPGEDDFPAAGASNCVWPPPSAIPASSPTSCITNSILNFSSEENQHHSSESTSGVYNKKARVEQSSAQPAFKVRKEKLGDRITALHQLVAPSGKTDTASVLSEAIGNIRFLQDQIEALSSPYMRHTGHGHHHPSLLNGIGMETGASNQGSDLRTRGLCLVPISCAHHMATSDGATTGLPRRSAEGSDCGCLHSHSSAIQNL